MIEHLFNSVVYVIENVLWTLGDVFTGGFNAIGNLSSNIF